jgi:hypothetical protein
VSKIVIDKKNYLRKNVLDNGENTHIIVYKYGERWGEVVSGCNA